MTEQLTAADLDKPIFTLTAEMAIISAYNSTSGQRIANSVPGDIVTIRHDWGEFSMTHEEFFMSLAKLRVMGKL